jgi:hypothetical protein
MTNRHRVLCFGGRAFVDAAKVDKALNQFWASISGEPFLLIHGGAKGADTMCGEWAKARGLPVARVDANWDAHGKAAGPIRNQWMLEYLQPTYAIGFPGGVGTRDMQLRLDQAKVPLWLIY